MATPTRQNVNAEGRPPMPAGQARELAREEVTRWTRVLEVLSTAATFEDEAGDTERRLAKLRADRETAEGAHLEALEQLKTAREAQQTLTDAVLTKTRAEIEAVQTEKEATLADLRMAIAAKQAELVQIGRDQDAARQAAAEHAGLLAEVQALRTERDELVAKLTR